MSERVPPDPAAGAEGAPRPSPDAQPAGAGASAAVEGARMAVEGARVAVEGARAAVDSAKLAIEAARSSAEEAESAAGPGDAAGGENGTGAADGTSEADPQSAPAAATDAPSGEELREAAAHGVRWSLISRPAVELIQLGSIVVLTRLIAPAEFGRFAIAVIAQEVAYGTIAGGLSNALVQRRAANREHLQTGLALALMIGVAMTLLTLLLATVVAVPVFGEQTAHLVRLMAPLCLIAGFTAVPMATLRRRMQFRRVSEMELAGTVGRVTVCIALALAGLGGEALVLGVLAGAVLTAGIAWASAPPPAPRLHRRAARELIDYGLPVSLSAIGWLGLRNVDYAIVGARLGPEATGLYYRAYTVAVEYENKISVVMSQVGFPVLARTRDHDELTRLHRQMVRTLTIVVFPLLVLLAIGAPVLIPFLFGSRWGGAVTPVQILTVGGAATLVIDAAGTVLMSKGRTRALLGYGTGQFIVYGLAVLAVVHWGIVAVAIAAAAVHTAFLFVAYGLILHGTPERPLRRLWEDLSPALVSCAGMAAVTLPLSIAMTALGIRPLLWLSLLGLAGACGYAATLRIFFLTTWRSQLAVVRRILPLERRLGSFGRRAAALAARSSA